jgi:hypothetical protein
MIHLQNYKWYITVTTFNNQTYYLRSKQLFFFKISNVQNFQLLFLFVDSRINM